MEAGALQICGSAGQNEPRGPRGGVKLVGKGHFEARAVNELATKLRMGGIESVPQSHLS